jgi:mRNA interferase RelE/StbE
LDIGTDNDNFEWSGRVMSWRGLSKPQNRLRVGEIRVFYDVSKEAVEVLAIVAKSQSEAWLREAGESI